MKARFLAVALATISPICGGFFAPARAATASVATDVAPRESLPAVEIAVVGDFANADAVGARIASWFEGQAVATRTSRVPRLDARVVFGATQTAGVRLWVVLSAPTDARLFFTVQERAGEAARYLVQSVELSGGVDELGLERLAQVAYLSAVALWEGSVESTRGEVEQRLPGTKPALAETSEHPNSPTVAPEASDEAAWHAHGGVQADLSFRGKEGVFWGPGLTFKAAFVREAAEYSLGGYLSWYGVPHEAEAQGVRLELTSFAVGLPLGSARRLSRDLWLGIQLGPILERVSCRTKALSDPMLRASATSQRYRPSLLGALGLRLDLGPLSYVLSATVSVPLVQVHYDIEDTALPEGHEELIVPWAVQPGASLGVLY